MPRSLSIYLSILRSDFFDYCEAKLREVGLSNGLLFFVIYLGKHPGCTMGALAAALDADTGHTSRSVNKLVQTGLAIRTENPSDGRSYLLRLTEAGEQVFERMHTLFDEWDEMTLRGMAPEDREQLYSLLERLVLEKRSDRHGPCNV